MSAGARALSVALGGGTHALAGGLLWIEASASIVVADLHLGYEEAIGGALPLWSLDESLAALERAHAAYDARELILLGDVVHGVRLSDGAAARVLATMERLRTLCTLTIVAGNHEGRTRGAELLGDCVEEIERAGMLLHHGDRPRLSGVRHVIGHLHPSIALGGEQSVPAFLAAPEVIVLPAATPYSRGLNVLARDCRNAIGAYGARGDSTNVIAATATHCYPFGSIASLARATRALRFAP
uniref:Calcineurin-like phosphoesterase domain-containing protein n=1 Tax=mine drainage metagenome TaxID=410659 RepID=E6PI20_9ZZZZ